MNPYNSQEDYPLQRKVSSMTLLRLVNDIIYYNQHIFTSQVAVSVHVAVPVHAYIELCSLK